ncbi:hypothetical protein ACQ4N7_19745, partial [Nodosilinea sp. AN01ver1]
MTAFSDDTNIRAFRLVAAALNAPVAQPAWTEALLASLTPPLPLVDCDPLGAWSQSETATAVSVDSQGRRAKVPQPPGDADGRDRARSAKCVRPSAQLVKDRQLSGQASESGRDRNPTSAIAEVVSGTSSDPAVPSRSQTSPAAPIFPIPTIAPSPAIASLDLPENWTTVPPRAAAPLATLAEIGRLTSEILVSTPATSERSSGRSHLILPSQPSTAAKPAAIAPSPSTPAPLAAAPPPSLAPAAFSPPSPYPPFDSAQGPFPHLPHPSH